MSSSDRNRVPTPRNARLRRFSTPRLVTVATLTTLLVYGGALKTVKAADAVDANGMDVNSIDIR